MLKKMVKADYPSVKYVKKGGKFIPMKPMGSITANNGRVQFTTKMIQMMRMTPPNNVITFSGLILDTHS